MDEAICQFSNVTGASPSVAEYYLEACKGDLENAIHQYLENPTDEGPLDELPQPVRTEIDLTAQDIEDPDWNPSPQVSPTGSGQMGRGEGLEDDHELQRALVESLRGGGSSSIEVEMESPRVGFGQVGSSMPAGSGGPQPQGTNDGPDLIVEGRAIDAHRIPSPPPNVVQAFEPQNWLPSDHPEFPPDVDLREAEMYEAVHFGVPYNGRIPRYAPPRSPSPDTKARRVMVSNQDQEYNESLKADREKAEAAEREANEAKERERLRQEELLAAANRKAEEEAHLLRLIETKKLNIPDEPSETAPNTIALVIRLPDGSKLSRRFGLSTPLQVLFDYVDVEVDGKGNLPPGSYNLLRQFPKKVYVPDDVEGSLEAVGLTSDEALFAMKRG